jgi:peptidoglycan/xylan/chitin deacetylase (PgdA/CDA1 family)
MFILIRKKTIVVICVLLVFVFGVTATLMGHLFSFAATKEYPKLPIIMYHQMTQKNGSRNDFVISTKQFESDLKYLKDNGYESISMQQVIDYKEKGTKLPEKPVMITFDDGFESFYTYAYPLLQKYQTKAVLSITGVDVDKYSQVNDHNLRYSHLTWDEVVELSKCDLIEIGNHTYNMHEKGGARRGCHINKNENLETYQKVLTEDLLTLQNELKEHINKEPVIFAYPFGCKCDEAKNVIKEMGFKAILTCYGHVNQLGKSDDWIYDLGRFNRVPGKSSEAFFTKCFKK